MDEPTKHLALKAIRPCIHEFHGIVENKEAVLKDVQTFVTAIFPGLRAEGGKYVHFPVIPWKRSDCKFTSCSWGFGFQLAGILLLTAIIRRVPKPGGHFSHLPLLACFNNKTKSQVYTWKELVYVRSAPNFNATIWEMGSQITYLWYPTVIAFIKPTVCSKQRSSFKWV